MPRKTAQDFDQELLILFDAYVHGTIDRRGFLERAQKFATAGITAGALLAALSPDFAAGQQVAKDDKRITTQMLSLPVQRRLRQRQGLSGQTGECQRQVAGNSGHP